MNKYYNMSKESNVTIALIVLCQDYILFDDELMKNNTIKKSMQIEDFWVELSKHLYGTVRAYLESKRFDESEYDEFEDTSVKESEVLDFILDTNNRFELNDMILDTVEDWKGLKGKK